MNTQNIPVSPEAEATVLASIISDPNAIIYIADVTRPDDFVTPVYRWIADATWGCFKQKQPPTMAAVIDKLRKYGRWRESTSTSGVCIEDIDKILESATITDLEFAVHNAAMVRNAAFRRNGKSVLEQASGLFYNDELEPGDIQKKVLTAVGSVFDAYAARDASVAAIGDEERTRLQHIKDGDVPGIPCGISWLDELVGGFLPSECWVIAAPYKQRKTTLQLNMVLSVAQSGVPVSVFTVGDSSRAATYRKLLALLFAKEWKRGGNDLSTVMLSARSLLTPIRSKAYIEYKEHCEAVLDELPIRLYDGRDLVGNLEECGRILRRDVAMHGTRVFCYDFAQASGQGTDYEKVTRFAGWVQGITGELGVTSVSLSQLNESKVYNVDDGSHSPGVKGGGALPAAANVLLTVRYKEPTMTVELKLARDAPMGESVPHVLHPPSGLILS